MAGLMRVGGGGWSASSWLFRWVLTRLADDAGLDRRLESALREIVDENLGWFSLEELGPIDRSMVRSWLADRLVADAVDRLPVELAEREAVLGHLAELAELAGDLRGGGRDVVQGVRLGAEVRNGTNPRWRSGLAGCDS
ncbi:hypothetical protein [Kribbella ginsengisoli]|uniref:hypothetical protein n=1 Tax=Kribbella ginsengisoli TaxID=363865 RepID=UPI0031E052AD